MEPLRIGIIGSGFIAGVVAEAAKNTPLLTVSAVCSRLESSASDFAAEYGIEHVFEDWQQLISSDEIDAVYVATPTSVREEISVAAANAGKHIFAEKPFESEASLARIINAARVKKIAFMDATHFSHNPRTDKIKQTMTDEIGPPKLLRSTFYYPFDDRNNIRFDPAKEPLAAVGDLAWYNMRAIVEFFGSDAEIEHITAYAEKDEQTGIVIRGSGAINFKDGTMSSFDFGFNGGVILMDLDIIGDKGMFRMDDFVLDWNGGFDFSDGHYDLSYQMRANLDEPDQWQSIKIESEKPQKILMLENFVDLTADPCGENADKSMKTSLKTQQLVDALFSACNVKD